MIELGRGSRALLILLGLAIALLAIATMSPIESSAVVTPKRCGTIQANGKTFSVRGHLVNCRFARRVSKGFLRHGIRPDGWSCRRYPPQATRIAFTCRRGGKDVYAIRR
jgi:hypothetical protein